MTIYFFSLSDHLTPTHSTTLQPVNRLSSSKLPTVFDTEGLVRLENNRRIRHLRDACADNSLFENKVYSGSRQLKYNFSKKYNFSYCKVPKAGCSFWTQAFTILETGVNNSERIFGMSRSAIHTKLTGKFHVRFDSEARTQSRTVLVSRDPYSRLYSAFVDKMYLPLFYKTAMKIVQKQRGITQNKLICANDITFQEFLQYIVGSVHRGRILNRHWAPIFSLCKPCDVHAFALVKQESFSADVEYALKEIGVANDQFEAIYDALHDHRVEATIPGIITTVLKLVRTRGCMNKIDIARRIWVSFQVQGFIKDTIAFPSHLVDTEEKVKKARFLTNIILQTIKENPLTSEQSKAQRRRALENAYRSVSENVIEGIKIVYKQDFILYDYSFDPPSRH